MRRRNFLSLLAAGAGVVLTRRAGAAVAPKRFRAAPVLVDGLEPGMMLGGCKLLEVRPPQLGALPLILATPDGTRFQVDVMRRDPSGPEGVATTASLSVFVHNGGRGQSPTAEAEGLGAMAVASLLASREAAVREALLPSLLTFDQRRAKYPSGNYCVLPPRRTA